MSKALQLAVPALIGAGFVISFAAPSASAQFATSVVQFAPGPSANPGFGSAKALGGPLGGGLTGGSTDVCVLGVGGVLDLGFASDLKDLPGADFLVFENGFTSGGLSVFAEVAAVEVSSDGIQFARFPTRYSGAPAPQPAFGSIAMGTFAGLTGGMPVVANVATNLVDPRDAAAAGGEAFDLAELATHPLVVAGQLDLGHVKVVRIVDVPAGLVADSFGNLIFDNGGATGSADIDAVAVAHDLASDAHAPTCDLSLDAARFLTWTIGDPDGIGDLDGATLLATFDLAPLPVGNVLAAFAVTAFDGKVATLKSLAPVSGNSLLGAFGVRVKDHAGRLGSDQVMIPN